MSSLIAPRAILYACTRHEKLSKSWIRHMHDVVRPLVSATHIDSALARYRQSTKCDYLSVRTLQAGQSMGGAFPHVQVFESPNPACLLNFEHRFAAHTTTVTLLWYLRTPHFHVFSYARRVCQFDSIVFAIQLLCWRILQLWFPW